MCRVLCSVFKFSVLCIGMQCVMFYAVCFKECAVIQCEIMFIAVCCNVLCRVLCVVYGYAVCNVLCSVL